jgi:hypothetical protein
MSPKNADRIVVAGSGLVGGALILGIIVLAMHVSAAQQAKDEGIPPRVLSAGVVERPSEVPMPNGEVARIAPGQSAKITYHTEGSQDNGSHELSSSGTATGSGAKASGDAVKTKYESELPALNIGFGVSAMGGKDFFSSEALISTGPGLLFLLGVLLVVAGIFLAVNPWIKVPGLPMPLIVCGIVVMGIAYAYQKAGWLFLVPLAVVGLFAIYLIVKAHQAHQATTAFATTVGGVEAGETIGPADLVGVTVAPEQTAFAQQVIDATVKAIKAKVQTASEKQGGIVAAMIAKLGL